MTGLPSLHIKSETDSYTTEIPAVYVKGVNGDRTLVRASQVSTAEMLKIFHEIAGSKKRDIQLVDMLDRIRHAFRISDNNLVNRETGEPYFYHCRAVALILMYELNIVDPEMVLAALGHDLVEDARALKNICPESSKYTPVELLASHYGRRVAQLIDSQTKPKYPKEKTEMTSDDKLRHKIQTYSKLFLKGDPIDQLRLKTCDRVHNLRTANDDQMRRKKTEETIRFLLPLVQHYLTENEVSLLTEAYIPYVSLASSDIQQYEYSDLPSREVVWAKHRITTALRSLRNMGGALLSV